MLWMIISLFSLVEAAQADCTLQVVNTSQKRIAFRVNPDPSYAPAEVRANFKSMMGPQGSLRITAAQIKAATDASVRWELELYNDLEKSLYRFRHPRSGLDLGEFCKTGIRLIVLEDRD